MWTAPTEVRSVWRKRAKDLGCGLDELPTEVFTRVSEHFRGMDRARIFAPEAATERRGGVGGTSTAAVWEQIERLRRVL